MDKQTLQPGFVSPADYGMGAPEPETSFIARPAFLLASGFNRRVDWRQGPASKY